MARFSPRTRSVSTLAAADSPAPCPCSPEIKRDGQSINAQTKKKYALIGQRIKLSISGCSGEMTEIRWDVPGEIFDKFEVTPTTGKRIPVSSFDDKSSIEFCWADAGNGRTISVSFKIGNASCSGNATMDVKEPTVTAGTRGIGTVQCLDTGSHKIVTLWGFTPPGGDTTGMYIEFSVDVPLDPAFGFAKGKWAFAQIINAPTERKKESASGTDKCFNRNTNGKDVLDGSFPLFFEYNTNSGESWSASDDPHDPLESNVLERYTNLPFETYVMFRPSPADQWVPLNKTPWMCKWCAKKCPSGWQLLDKGQSLGNTTKTSSHPKWDAVWQQGAYVESQPCPNCGECQDNLDCFQQ